MWDTVDRERTKMFAAKLKNFTSSLKLFFLAAVSTVLLSSNVFCNFWKSYHTKCLISYHLKLPNLNILHYPTVLSYKLWKTLVKLYFLSFLSEMLQAIYHQMMNSAWRSVFQYLYIILQPFSNFNGFFFQVSVCVQFKFYLPKGFPCCNCYKLSHLYK